MKLVTVKVGDKNHEPTQEELKQIRRQVTDELPEGFKVLVYPYFMDLTNHENTETSLKENQIEEVQKKLVENVKAETEVKIP